MKRLVTMVAASGLIMGVISTATANPISCELLRLQQIPETQHVQITFGSQCATDTSMDGLSRDGSEMATDWQEFAGFSTNTGSGVEKVSSFQMCDCDVPLGEHIYEVAFTVQYDSDDFSDKFDQEIEVVDSAAAIADETEDEPVPEEEDGPWNEPDPEGVQGLDCAKVCSEGGPGIEASAAVSDDSGCSVSAGVDGRVGGLSVLLFGLGLLILRRARQDLSH